MSSETPFAAAEQAAWYRHSAHAVGYADTDRDVLRRWFIAGFREAVAFIGTGELHRTALQPVPRTADRPQNGTPPKARAVAAEPAATDKAGPWRPLECYTARGEVEAGVRVIGEGAGMRYEVAYGDGENTQTVVVATVEEAQKWVADLDLELFGDGGAGHADAADDPAPELPLEEAAT